MTIGSIEISRFGQFEVAYRCGTADEKVFEHSFDHDIFFANVPEYKPQPADAILDAGAHIGTFSLLAASKAPLGRVLAVEPSRESFNLLRINAALNHFPNIEPLHCAFSQEPGSCLLFHDVENWGHTTVRPISERAEVVQGVTIEGLMKERGLERIQFAKFNCEGAEFPAILSAPVEVLQKIGILLVLYHADLYQAGDPGSLARQLHESGFSHRFWNVSEKRGWLIGVNRHS